MATELQAASIRVRIDPAEAERELDRIEREVVDRKKRQAATGEQGIEVAPVPTPVDDARGERGDPTGTRRPRRRGYNPADDGSGFSGVPAGVRATWDRARAAWGTPPSQHISNLAFAIANAVPVAGPIGAAAMRSGQFVGEYGAAGLGMARELLPEAARPAFDQAVAPYARGAIDLAYRVKAAGSALDRTTEQAKDLVATAAVWGVDVAPSVVAREFDRLYSVNYALDRGRIVKDRLTQELVGGQAVRFAGAMIAELADAFTAGSAR